MRDIVNKINRKYVAISNKLTPAYEKAFALPCDIYLPIFNSYKEDVKYRDQKIFAPHQSCSYPKNPNYTNVLYYIPNLIKDSNMNSPENEFDAFYMQEDATDRPFIETTKKKELPIQTKVVVKRGKSIMKFFVDKKTVVTGTDGFMLLRMYLSPLAKDNDDGEPESLDQQEFIPCPEGDIFDTSEEIIMNIPED